MAVDGDGDVGGYDAVLRRRKDGFVCLVRELNLVGRGTTPDEAFGNLRENYRALIAELTERGELDALPERKAMRFRDAVSNLSLFTVKCAIVVIAILGIAGIGFAAADRSIRSARSLNTNILVEIEKLARRVNEIPEDQIGKTREHLRSIATRLGPLASELRPLTNPEPAAPAR